MEKASTAAEVIEDIILCNAAQRYRKVASNGHGNKAVEEITGAENDSTTATSISSLSEPTMTPLKQESKAKTDSASIQLSELKPLNCQVGGLSTGKKPVLSLLVETSEQMNEKLILKPMRADSRSVREIAFYELLSEIHKSASSESLRLLSSSDEKFYLHQLWYIVFHHRKEKNLKSFQLPHEITMKEIDVLKNISISFTASYHGIYRMNQCENNTASITKSSSLSSIPHLVLTDATSSYRKPNVIDIKMGKQTFDSHATTEKKELEIRKYPQQSIFGFRIVGMKVHSTSSPKSCLQKKEEEEGEGFWTFDKDFGRCLDTKQSVIHALRFFFYGGHVASSTLTKGTFSRNAQKGVRFTGRGGQNTTLNETIDATLHEKKHAKNTMSILLQKLKVLQQTLAENKTFAMYASSILMTSEGDIHNDNDEDNGGDCAEANLKMIDFAHVQTHEGGDAGYLHGLHTLIEMITELLQEG